MKRIDSRLRWFEGVDRVCIFPKYKDISRPVWMMTAQRIVGFLYDKEAIQKAIRDEIN